MGNLKSLLTKCFKKKKEDQSLSQNNKLTPDYNDQIQLRNTFIHSQPESGLISTNKHKLVRQPIHPIATDQKNYDDSDDSQEITSILKDRNSANRITSWVQSNIIGRGSFGCVYFGMDRDTGLQLAVKQVELKVRNLQMQQIEALEREINMLSKLSHKNIVSYYGMERTDEHLNIFLEYVGGGSIAKIVKQFGPLHESVIKTYMKQVALGLSYLHSHGVVHRDIKGANLLVDKMGICKLADFGSSKQLGQSEQETLTGTPNWMAPEVIRQDKSGRKSDIWSLGCTMIEMATGQPPWGNFSSPIQALYFISNMNSAPPIPEHLSDTAKEFLSLCLRLNPKERWSVSRLLKHPFLKRMNSRQPTQQSGNDYNRSKGTLTSTMRILSLKKTTQIQPEEKGQDIKQQVIDVTPSICKSRFSKFDFDMSKNEDPPDILRISSEIQIKPKFNKGSSFEIDLESDLQQKQNEGVIKMNNSAYEIFEIVSQENNESPKHQQQQFNINIINPENKLVYSSDREIIIPIKMDQLDEIKTGKILSNLQKSASHSHSQIGQSEIKKEFNKIKTLPEMVDHSESINIMFKELF